MPGQSWTVRSLLMLSVLLCPSRVSAGDPEHVSIQILLSPQATSYQRHTVTVEGVIRDLQVLSPSAARYCLAIHGRASFVVEDETGSVPVDVLGACHPNADDTLPKEGDRVRITGLVHVLTSDAPRQVRIQAGTIQIVESTHE